MIRKVSLIVAILSILTLLDSQLANSQQISVDGNTATIVTKKGDRLVIDGNTLSKDGKNLFHSFREFGLSNQQIATFLTNPNIENILTRVTGGNSSYINGLIEVVGGNSNLFLMNPAGIVFGSGASINVPADFTATTATGIGFNNGILNAIGSNDYQNLTGNPTNFVFNTNQNGSIINAGELKVAQGSNINLIGGNVINTGIIETPNGNINIQAVKGTSRIKITPEGSLLSLEIDIPKDEQGNLLGFTPQDLPTLLTGANNAGVTTPNVTVNNNQVQVANTNIPNETGMAIASGKISTSSDNLGGKITVLGNKVGVINGEIEANGAIGGGKVLIGGDFQGKGTIPNSQVTIVDENSIIKANALTNGNGGDVIIWADKNTSFAGSIEAKGGENGGNGGLVEVSGKENLFFNGEVNTNAVNGNNGMLLLDPVNVTIVNGSEAINDSQIIDGQILAGDGGEINYTISENALESLSDTTNVLIQATNNITIKDLSDNNLTFASNLTTGSLTPDSRTSVTFTADADKNNSGNFSMNANDTIVARGRNVTISGANINIGFIDTSRVNSENNGGDIILNSPKNTIIQGNINANSLITNPNGTTRLNGNVTTIGDQTYNDKVILNKNTILTTNNLTAKSLEVDKNSSNLISLTINANDSISITGKVNSNFPLAISTARNNQPSGNITINALNNINITGAINTTANDVNNFVTNAGNVSIASQNGNVSVFAIGTFGTITSGEVNVSGNNLNLGPIISFINIPNVPNSNGGIINLQGNNTIISGEIRGESLTITGNLTLNNNPNIPANIPFFGNSNITTIKDQIYNDKVVVNNGVKNITFTGNNLTFENTLDGEVGFNFNSTNNGITTFNNIVGEIIPLSNLTTNADGTTKINGNVTTKGNQTYNDDVILDANTIFNAQGFSAQNIISTGNNLTVNSDTTIKTGKIETTGDFGNGGDVTLIAQKNIQATSIDTSSLNGKGGNVNISTLGRLKVTDNIANTDISIDSRGINEGGSILIDFFPDNSQIGKTSDTRLPFIVGDPSSNGTKGIITNREFSIAKDKYFEIVKEGNININLLEPQIATPTPINDPLTAKLQLLTQEGDPNNAIPPRLEVKTLTANVYPPILPISTIAQAQEILTTIEREAAEKPAFIYVTFTPKGYQPLDLDEEFARREALNTQEYSRVDINKPNLQPIIALKPAQEDQLDLLIITSKGKPVRIIVPVTREQVVGTANNLWASTSDSFALNENYKPYATDLYSWLIASIEDKLKEEKISNLLFILPTEIRFIPIAALYDGNSKQFLVEKYSSGLAPSLNLNDNTYRPMKDLNLLAMGASQFADNEVTPLPAVGIELATIKKVWNDEPSEDYQRYLNSNFTLEEIKANLARKPYGIVHFGTHGEFNPTETVDSFIQLYNSRLPLNEINNLGLSQPLVELMVLSACETAFGNEIAELGFAGLAVKAGVKTAMGSVWQVSDTGTLALMTDFYAQLKIQTTKAEALRQTQLDMLTGKIYKTEDGSKIITPQSEVSLETLPESSRQKEDFSHPFYWAPFTMIGNPW